jgi:hypothetical protein
MYHAGGSRIRRNFTARPHSADGGGGGAHRAKFTGKMINKKAHKQSRLSVFFVAPWTWDFWLFSWSNDLDT